MSELIHMRLNGKDYAIDADPHALSVAETNAVERHTGMTVGEWGEKLADRRISTLAWTALAWVAKTRAGEKIRWEDLEADLKVMELIQATAKPEPPAPAAVATSPVAQARKAKRKASVKAA